MLIFIGSITLEQITVGLQQVSKLWMQQTMKMQEQKPYISLDLVKILYKALM